MANRMARLHPVPHKKTIITMKTMNNNKTTTKRSRRAAISAATMGTALATILASSSCQAFQSPTPCHVGSVGAGLLRTNEQHCTVTLHYRYGGDTNEMPIRMQAETKTSAEKTNRQSGWRLVSLPQLTFLKTASGPVNDDQQNVMDEYLEFIDRRYSRIHKKNAGGVSTSPQRRPKVVLDFQLPRKIFFSTLALHQRGQNVSVRTAVAASSTAMTSSSSPQALSELNALGLSDLASARLRQRLQAPRDLRDEYTAASYILDYLPSPAFEAAMPTQHGASPSASPAATAVAQPAVGGRVSSFSNVGAVAQYQLMIHTLRKFVRAFATAMKIMGNFASRAIPEILEKGGFRHSCKMMTAASLALLFMFKPLFKGAMKS